MVDQDKRHQAMRTAGRVASWLRRGVVLLIGLALLLAGLIIGGLTWYGGFTEAPYRAVGFGAFSFALMGLGGRLLYRLRSESQEQQQQPLQRKAAGQKQGGEAPKAVDKRETGRFALIKGLERTKPWIQTAIAAWFFLLPLIGMGCFLVLVGMVVMLDTGGTGKPLKTLGGGGLALLGLGLSYLAGQSLYHFPNSGSSEEE